ncbi:MAG: DNA repair protein RecO [Prevotella sp.]|nr:DNA repair protein RecO [Prevotella sp.]MDY4217813.1 DNA repair protein RecO [Prevotella sp.]
MVTKTKAIVLRSLKYGDASLIVDMLTEALGRVSFMVRIPKTTKAKVKKQLFQAMNILEVEFDYRVRVSIQRLKDVRLAIAYSDIIINPMKMSVLFFLSEFLTHVTRDEQENRPLFNYVINSLQWYDAQEHGVANFHLVFMMRLSKFVGFFPNLTDYTQRAYFDLRNGCFVSSAPLHGDFLNETDAEHMLLMMRMDYDNMHLFRLSRAERNRFTELAMRYYRLHVPTMPDVQSLDVLQSLFVDE